jgi:hypothetical protein
MMNTPSSTSNDMRSFGSSPHMSQTMSQHYPQRQHIGQASPSNSFGQVQMWAQSNYIQDSGIHSNGTNSAVG